MLKQVCFFFFFNVGIEGLTKQYVKKNIYIHMRDNNDAKGRKWKNKNSP